MILDKLPELFVRNIVDIHQDMGRDWIKNLPCLLEKYQDLWQITLVGVAPDLSYNLILRAKHNTSKRSFIFKAGVPNRNLDSEILCTNYYAGRGCVELINYSSVDGVLLLEEATPGATLATLTRNGQDSTAVGICADVILKLHKHKETFNNYSSHLPNLTKYMSDFAMIRKLIFDKNIAFDLKLLELAEQKYDALLASTTDTVILHGDLHHFNILSSERDNWLAIDPHGVIGDPAFEVAAFMRNPYPGFLTIPDFKELLHQRLELFAKLLPYDKYRIWGWSFAQTILTAGWVLQDHGVGWEEWYITARHILELEPC